MILSWWSSFLSGSLVTLGGGLKVIFYLLMYCCSFLEQAAFTVFFVFCILYFVFCILYFVFFVFFAGIGSPGLFYNSMEFFTKLIMFCLATEWIFCWGGGPITSVEGQASLQSLDLYFKWKTS